MYRQPSAKHWASQAFESWGKPYTGFKCWWRRDLHTPPCNGVCCRWKLGSVDWWGFSAHEWVCSGTDLHEETHICMMVMDGSRWGQMVFSRICSSFPQWNWGMVTLLLVLRSELALRHGISRRPRPVLFASWCLREVEGFLNFLLGCPAWPFQGPSPWGSFGRIYPSQPMCQLEGGRTFPWR